MSEARSSIENADADDVIRLLDLKPHPEGGFYRETFRDSGRTEGGRAASTAIYFLLREGQVSHWHKVDAAEIWNFYAGAPLEISIWRSGASPVSEVLGPDLFKGERPQFVAPAHWWQSARSLGAWTLVGCVVAPGFEFAHFELAPPEWAPG